MHGLPGHNIECDLHMEHINRVCKSSIKGTGANKTKKAIQRAAKVIGKSSVVVDNFAHVIKCTSHHRSILVQILLKIVILS